jgi:hypothetical protein
MKTIILRFALLGLLSALPIGMSWADDAQLQQPEQTWIQPAGRYAGYHEFLDRKFADRRSRDVAAGIYSADVAATLAKCEADATVAQMTPEDLAVLDAAARGERAAPRSLVEKSLEWLTQPSAFGLARLVPFQRYCPETFEKYQRYLL